MDAEDEVAAEARNGVTPMASESPHQQDAPEIQVPAETSVPTSPESTNEEFNLPSLIQDDKNGHEITFLPSEIPDSDAISAFSSPVKTYQAFRGDAETHDAGTELLASIPNVAASQDVLHTEDEEMGDGVTKEAESEAIELRGVNVTSEAATLTPLVDLANVALAVITHNSMIDSSPTPERLALQDRPLAEDEQKGDVAMEADGSEAIEPHGTYSTSEAAASPPPVEVDEIGTTTVIDQYEGSIIEPENTTSDDVSHAEPLSTVPEEIQAVEIPPSDIDSEDSKEENAALDLPPDTVSKKDKQGNEVLQTIIPDHSPISTVDNAVAINNEAIQGFELPTSPKDSGDVIMGDDIPEPNEPAVNFESTIVTKEIAEKEIEKGKETQQLHMDTKAGHQRTIADSDDEEFSDVPVPENIPEPEPKVLKKGRKKSKTVEKPVEKVAKKRGRPKKVVVPEVQQKEPAEESNEATETTEDPSHSMNMEEESSMLRNDAEHIVFESTTTEPDAMEYHHDNDHAPEPSVHPADASKEISTPISSSPPKSAIQTPVKVRISPNPSFKMPSPVKKSQAQSSAMILSSPSRDSSSAAVATSQEGDDGSAAATGSQNQTKDVVLAELKAMKMV
jgi:hypothetical protein